jgi:hypothetical protein
MKSVKHKAKVPFQPIKNPTPKVREAWSRFFGALAVASFAGGTAILTTVDCWTITEGLKIIAAIIGGITFLTHSIFSLKGA